METEQSLRNRGRHSLLLRQYQDSPVTYVRNNEEFYFYKDIFQQLIVFFFNADTQISFELRASSVNVSTLCRDAETIFEI